MTTPRCIEIGQQELVLLEGLVEELIVENQHAVLIGKTLGPAYREEGERNRGVPQHFYRNF
jgi:hypothetical protein